MKIGDFYARFAVPRVQGVVFDLFVEYCSAWCIVCVMIRVFF